MAVADERQDRLPLVIRCLLQSRREVLFGIGQATRLGVGETEAAQRIGVFRILRECKLKLALRLVVCAVPQFAVAQADRPARTIG